MLPPLEVAAGATASLGGNRKLGRFGYGMMVVAAGVGYLAGSTLLTTLAGRLPTRWLISCGGIVVGIGYLLYALAHGFWQAVAGLILLGLFGSAAGVGYSTYLQHALPAEQMGRVNNVLGPPQQLATLAMMAVASAVTASFGVRALMIVMTCVMIATGVWSASLALQRRHRSAIDEGGFAA